MEEKVQIPSEVPVADKVLSEKPHVLKSFPKKLPAKGTILLAIGALLVVLAGVGTGWLLSRKGGEASSGVTQTGGSKDLTEAGVMDEKAFPDSAEGVLKEGGINGEGTHHLDRGLGPTKDVYLTSTGFDLQGFVDKKVKVWGETVAGKHAGWLMDVGKIKVIE